MDRLIHLRRKFHGGHGQGSGVDWTQDASLKALYYFEDKDLLGRDYSGKGNHLDAAPADALPWSEGTTKIQGSQSAGFNGDGPDDRLYALMTNLSADFPCNGAGTTDVTVGGWIRPALGLGGEPSVAGWLYALNRIVIDSATGKIYTKWYGEYSTADLFSTDSVSLNKWFFVVVVYSSTEGKIRIYLREEGAAGYTPDEGSTTAGPLYTRATEGFILCANDPTGGWSFNGNIDAWAVFKGKAFTFEELDGVFDWGWDGNGWVTTPYTLGLDFEETGTPNRVVVTSGAPNFGYTPALAGNESVYCQGYTNSVWQQFYWAYAGYVQPVGPVYIYFMFRVENVTADTITAFFFLQRDSGGRCWWYLRQGKIRLTDQTTELVTGFSTGVTYHAWAKYDHSTGYCDFAFSTDGNRPTGGDNFASTTVSPAASEANRLYLNGSYESSTRKADIVFDKIRISDAQIGNNPA